MLLPCTYLASLNDMVRFLLIWVDAGVSGPLAAAAANSVPAAAELATWPDNSMAVEASARESSPTLLNSCVSGGQ